MSKFMEKNKAGITVTIKMKARVQMQNILTLKKFKDIKKTFNIFFRIILYCRNLNIFRVVLVLPMCVTSLPFL